MFLNNEGRVYCCGDGEKGQLGNGLNKRQLFPKMIELDFPIVGIACGVSHTLFLT